MERPYVPGGSPPEGPARVGSEYFTACNAHDPAWVMRTHQPDAFSVFCDWPRGILEGAVAIAEFWGLVFRRRPDCFWTEDHYIVEGDRVALEWSLQASYGPLGRIWVSGCDVFRVEGGRIASAHQYWDGSVARLGRPVRAEDWGAPMPLP